MSASQDTIRVLHVDDEPDLADLTATYLEREDERLAIETATSAEEGADHLSDDEFDCIISDYNMPGQDGLEFLETVRQDYSNLPFILYTGKGSEEVASEAISAGVTDYLQKETGTEQYELLANRIINAVQAWRATQKVTRQEELTRLTEFAGDTGGWELTLDTNELLLTDGTRRLLDLSPNETLTFPEALELYHPDDRNDVKTALDEVVETSDQVQNTWRIQPADGEQRLLDVVMTPVTSNGEVTAIRGSLNDVTGQYERREELEQIETWFQHAQTGLFLLDVGEEFTVERVNPAWEETTGLSAEQVCGQTLQNVLGEQAGAIAEQKSRECVQQREPVQFEENIHYDAGQTTWITRVAPVVVNETIEYIVGETREITDRRERKRELRLLQQAIDDANVAITLIDPTQDDNPFVYVNNAYEELTGYDSKGVLGRSCWFLRGEDTDPETVTTLREALDNEESVTVELRNYRKDGSEFWNRVTVSPVYDDNELVRYLFTQQDVTERKERERELKNEQRFIEQSLNALDSLFYVLDANGTIRRWNERVLEVTGYTESELDGMHAIEVFPENQQERIADAISQTLSEGHATVKADLQTADADRRPYEWTGARLTDTDGNTTGLVGIGRDLTERRRRERRFQALVESSNDMISIVDTDGTFQYQSPSAERILGYDSETMVGDTAWDYIHPEDREAVVTQFEEWIDNPTETPDLIEYRAKHADGSWCWLESHANDQSDNPTVNGYVINSRDITEKKQREQQLNDERERYTTLFETLPTPVLHAKPENNEPVVQTVNPAFEDVFGCDAESISGDRLHEYILPEDKETDAQQLNQRIMTDGEIQTEVQRKTADGERTFQLNAQTRDTQNGGIDGYAVYTDITERKEYQQELEYYEQLINTFNDIATVIDSEGEVTFVSPSVRRVLGYEPEDLVGKNGFEYQPPETANAVQEAIEYVIEHPDESKIVQTKFRCSDGSWCWIESTIQNQLENDLIEGLVVNSRDITERREYEQKLKEQRDNLELINQVVRHDIRNDLQVIRGRTNLLEEYVGKSGQEQINIIQNSTKSAIELTNTARDLNETMLSTEADVEPVRIDQHLGSVINDARSEFDDTIITVKNSIPNSIVSGNELLEAVFWNLVQNAVVHNNKETPEIQLSVTAADKTLTVAVADNGPGIPDDQKEAIFGKGEKGLDSPGTGIGLYLVQTLVDQYGGDVWIDDNNPNGSIFIVELPIADTEQG